jgi:hypothetical protein
MPSTDIQEILKKVSTNNDLQRQFLNAPGEFSREDEDFKR